MPANRPFRLNSARTPGHLGMQGCSSRKLTHQSQQRLGRASQLTGPNIWIASIHGHPGTSAIAGSDFVHTAHSARGQRRSPTRLPASQPLAVAAAQDENSKSMGRAACVRDEANPKRGAPGAAKKANGRRGIESGQASPSLGAPYRAHPSAHRHARGLESTGNICPRAACTKPMSGQSQSIPPHAFHLQFCPRHPAQLS